MYSSKAKYIHEMNSFVLQNTMRDATIETEGATVLMFEEIPREVMANGTSYMNDYRGFSPVFFRLVVGCNKEIP